ERGGAFNHEWSTRNMRFFVQQGLERANAQQESVRIITTLYGPPAFMTQHHSPSSSVLKPGYKKDLALYMIDWVTYLKEHGYPVQYLSIHNEGTDWLRWPHYENHRNDVMLDRDYNLLWRPRDIAEFMAYMKPIMIRQGLSDVGLTPGEPINLFRFDHFGIAYEIARNAEALNSIDLITSHGFGIGNPLGRGYADAHNHGATLLHKDRPDLKTWITSMSWGQTGTIFCAEMYEHLYGNRASAIIPWAGIQRYSEWGEKNKHAACAITVLEDSTFQINKEYYFYKQYSRAGRPGMRVVKTYVNRPDVLIAAFAQDKSDHADAFVVINLGESLKYASDMIEFSFNVQDKNLYYSFPYKDPFLAFDQQTKSQMTGVQFAAQPTETGYIMEFAFPWQTLGGKPDSLFSFDAFARDGRDMPHGHIGWLGEKNSFTGKIKTGSVDQNDGRVVTISRVAQPLQIDGKKENGWMPASDYQLNHDLMPGTPPLISGIWNMRYDDAHLYVLVQMQDPSNEMGRLLEISLKGSRYESFRVVRTDELSENDHDLGVITARDGKINYLSPNHSVTTFIGVK
ncbi:hypothetical protein GF406_13245, partial [candidate division KSB1 bacterium]|nr:hypothetical protein [candidate division KSB1 bacterium]